MHGGRLARGVFREGAFARVSYDGRDSIPISKGLQKERGYDPPFEELPSKDEHEKVRSGQAVARFPRRWMFCVSI